MNVEYIIVQAGGKGTRLLPLTQNRPKPLVPVNNLPIIFHLFKKYPNKKFIIIGDYKFDVFSNYLETFADVDYLLIHANGEGNVTGIKQALTYIPENSPFMILWSDLLLSEDFDIEFLPEGCYAGITDRFHCSWRFEHGKLNKIDSNNHGLAGCFIFNEKSHLTSIPESGSFTKFLQSSSIPLKEMSMHSSDEAGTLEALNKIDSKENRCRPYNKISIEGHKVIKQGLTQEAKKLIEREVKWYKAVDKLGFKGIPKIYNLEPLTIGYINGDNIFKVKLNDIEKKSVIDHLFLHLEEMHNLIDGNINFFDMQEDYYSKTMKRLRSIRDVIPFSSQEEILINGYLCKNILYNPKFLREKVSRILTKSKFGIIHGDCTLTNTLIDEKRNIYFIDARGYFGRTELIGDIYYDWAKVYYSIQGAFDQFNVKNFSLKIDKNNVSYKIAPSGWEHLTQYFLNKIPNCDEYRLKLIHAIIWLSLASHCWEDYDSLCVAFYNGLYLLNTLEL